VFLAACSQRTRRIRLGHGIVQLPQAFNHSARVAERIATLDLVSDGRVEFGTGEASSEAELGGFGIDRETKREQWSEALDAVTRMFVEEPFAGWDGKHLRMPVRNVVPKPLQRPHPPLWVASTTPESHELAGKKGLGLLSFTIGVPPEELAGRIRLYRKALEQAEPIGKVANGRAATFTMVHCAETAAEARTNAAESFEWYARRGVEQIATLGHWQQELHHDLATYQYTRAMAQIDTKFLTFDFLESTGACIVGDPERCIETARRYRAAGCDILLCLVQPWKIPHEKVMKSIELLGKHVIPALERA
jgi:alkanesulfonate monooxygenase SsuD/methylene tetrahydromethanopterin reductase-like flavin-dependent oxidoreductase (luciferase family)